MSMQCPNCCDSLNVTPDYGLVDWMEMDPPDWMETETPFCCLACGFGWRVKNDLIVWPDREPIEDDPDDDCPF